MNRTFIAFALITVSICTVKAQSVLTGDAYIYNSACVGQDCVVPESFGFFTIKMKENNTQIRFEDTSAPDGGFPSMDWTIGANETASGGKNLFFIDDETHRIVTIEGGAPFNSLYINPAGMLGLKTASPQLELHLSDGDSPGIRLEQNTGMGYSAQTWDVAGNETNFFVRDVNTNMIPFKILPGAQDNSLVVHPSGNVSLGLTGQPPADPGTKLYVNGSLIVNGDITALSDRRIKTNIAELDYGLAAVMQLSAKKYDFTSGEKHGLTLSAGPHFGLIAQDVEAIIPEIVSENIQVTDDEGHLSRLKGIDYLELIPILIKATQEQQVLIEKQQAQIGELQARIAQLEK